MSKMSKAIAVLGVVAGLGVAALPLSSYATTGIEDTESLTTQAIVGDSIAISVDKNTVTMGTTVQAGQDPAEGSATVTIQTNNVAGYKLEIKDADTTTALKPTAGGTTDGIPAGVPTKNENYWGFKASTSAAGVTLASGASDYRAVKPNPQSIASKTTASATDGDDITLTFGVTVSTSIAAGTYEDVVEIIATTN